MFFCFSGNFKNNRKQLINELRKLGHHVSDHMFFDTNFLVMNIESEKHNKYYFAIENKIPIITEKELIERFLK